MFVPFALGMTNDEAMILPVEVPANKSKRSVMGTLLLFFSGIQ